MSANRKLQTEIDRVLKKVEEGVEVFDDIWDKVYSAAQQALKEKYEGDLKKEIKKLQRLRDQIKTWIGSNDIRDKSSLIEARKLIETKMEQFKVCEKETKTKAYSKEGLARSDILDPHEQEKQVKREWLQECIDKLNEFVDSTEADIERLSGSKGRRHKEEAEALEAKTARHRHHISKLEQIMRVMDNDTLDPARVDEVKDDVEYYIELAQEADGDQQLDDTFDIYEELGLDELTLQLVTASALERPRASSDSKPSEDDVEVTEPEAQEDSEEKSAVAASTGATAATLPSPAGAKSKKAVAVPATGLPLIGRPQKKVEKAKPVPAPKPVGQASPLATPTPTPVAKPSVPVATVKRDAKQVLLNTAPTVAQAPAGQPNILSSPITGSSVPVIARVTAQPPQPQAASKSLPGQSPTLGGLQSKPSPITTQPVPAAATSSIEARGIAIAPRPQDLGSQQPTALKSVPQSPQRPPIAPTKPSPQIRPQQSPSPQLTAMSLNQQQILQGGESPRASGVPADPSVVAAQRSLLSNPEVANAAAMLRSSMVYAPMPQDGDRQKAYQPRNPAPCHPSFPTSPAPVLDNPALFEKLPADTLFFIFYFQQGSYQQYLAARQLKKHSWRFHKKYSTWFQRHEEPKVSAEEYEEGTYVYFDYESGWCQRIKSEFKFEYAFLEDELSA